MEASSANLSYPLASKLNKYNGKNRKISSLSGIERERVCKSSISSQVVALGKEDCLSG